MSTIEVLNTTILASAILINVLLLIMVILGSNLKERIYSYFLILVIINLAQSICEFVIYRFNGNPNEIVRVVLQSANYFIYLVIGSQIIAFSLYLYEYFKPKLIMPRKLIYLLVFLAYAAF